MLKYFYNNSVVSLRAFFAKQSFLQRLLRPELARNGLAMTQNSSNAKFLNNKAQVNFAEYALLFVVVVGVMTAMGIYFKRAIQARMRDTRIYMFKTVQDRAPGTYNTLYVEYEPYYVNTLSAVDHSASAVSNIYASPGKASGLFRQTTAETTTVQTLSVTAPPVNAI